MLNWRLLLLLLCGVVAGCTTTAPKDLRATLRESVVMISTPGLIAGVQLQTTLFRPPGNGPHPVVVINHGKAKGDPSYQKRFRPLRVVREFLNRGYAVAVPMRQGFAGSTGFYKEAGCNFARNGLRHAEDIRHVIDYLSKQPDMDTQRVVVIGHSAGGLATLALGTFQLPNVVGLINFSGGLRNDDCTESGKQLARYVASYGASTKVPSLWFYGNNDSVFPPAVWQPMHAQYQQAGGKATLIRFGNLKGDAHGMFGGRDALPIWLPEVTRFMAGLGMPFVNRHRLALATHNKPVPTASGFAKPADYNKLPFELNEMTPARYQKFLSASAPKALAISATGAWGWSSDVPDAMQRALDRCNKKSGAACRLYAVDDAVVW